ncbi:MAG: AEC family transporter [Firmicutes bacterium]|nr:AEC family transporter [Bacillota bacterium]
MDITLMTVAMNAIIKMLLMVLVGFMGYKIGFIDEKDTDSITRMLSNILCPATLLASYFKEFETEKARSLFMAIGMGLLIHLLSILISKVAIRKKNNPDWEVEQLIVTFGNMGFMGIPLIQAMFGEDGVFLQSGILLVANIMLWSYGVMVFAGKADKKGLVKMLLSPNILCIAVGMIVYFGRIPVPALIKTPIVAIGDCMTPVAMIVSGAIVAANNLSDTLKNKRSYLVMALRLIAAPLAMVPFFYLLGTDHLLAVVSFTAAGCPAAAMVAVLSRQYGKNESYASGLFTVTTLLSLLTIPAMLAVYSIIGV